MLAGTQMVGITGEECHACRRPLENTAGVVLEVGRSLVCIDQSIDRQEIGVDVLVAPVRSLIFGSNLCLM